MRLVCLISLFKIFTFITVLVENFNIRISQAVAKLLELGGVLEKQCS